MITIHIAMTALGIAAAVLVAAAVVTRGRLALILLSAGLFTVLSILAVEVNSGWMTALDTSVWNWFEAHRTYKWQGDSNGIFDYIGQPVHVAVAGVVSGLLLALQARSAMRALVVTGAVGTGAVVEQTLKAVVERTPISLGTLRDGSALDWYAHTFPSGHVTGSATLLGTIAVCLGIGRSRGIKAALAVSAVTGVLFVAVLTLYVRAHIFTDVIGGMVLGGALVALGAAALVAPTEEPQSPEERHVTPAGPGSANAGVTDDFLADRPRRSRVDRRRERVGATRTDRLLGGRRRDR